MLSAIAQPRHLPPTLHRPRTRARVAVLSNLRAGQARRLGYPGSALAAAVGPAGRAYAFESSAELGEMVREILAERFDIVAVNGGDGTVGMVLSQLAHATHGGSDLPLMAALWGGSLNSTARVLGTPQLPATQMVRLLAESLPQERQLHASSLQSLRIEDPNQPAPLHGFAFGTGLVHDCARYIQSHGATTARNTLTSLLRVTAQAAWAGDEDNPVWRDQAGEVTIDGERTSLATLRTAVAVGAATLPPFVQPFAPAPPSDPQPGFAFLVNAMPRPQLVRNLFGVLRGSYRGDDHWTGHAAQMTIDTDGGYLLDGELFPQRAGAPVTVSAGPRVRFWRCDGPFSSEIQ